LTRPQAPPLVASPRPPPLTTVSPTGSPPVTSPSTTVDTTPSSGASMPTVPQLNLSAMGMPLTAMGMAPRAPDEADWTDSVEELGSQRSHPQTARTGERVVSVQDKPAATAAGNSTARANAMRRKRHERELRKAQAESKQQLELSMVGVVYGSEEPSSQAPRRPSTAPDSGSSQAAKGDRNSTGDRDGAVTFRAPLTLLKQQAEYLSWLETQPVASLLTPRATPEQVSAQSRANRDSRRRAQSSRGSGAQTARGSTQGAKQQQAAVVTAPVRTASMGLVRDQQNPYGKIAEKVKRKGRWAKGQRPSSAEEREDQITFKRSLPIPGRPSSAEEHEESPTLGGMGIPTMGGSAMPSLGPRSPAARSRSLSSHRDHDALLGTPRSMLSEKEELELFGRKFGKTSTAAPTENMKRCVTM